MTNYTWPRKAINYIGDMDILYIVGTGSKWENNELRYSLRSIDKYGINVGQVFIVGEKPSFVNDNVIHIPCKDRYGSFMKHNNIHHKIGKAIKSGLLSEHFLISSDDHFYCKPTDFDNYPVYYREREIPTRVPEGTKPNTYWFSLFETRRFLLENRLPIYQTNPHANTHIDTRIWNSHEALFTQAYGIHFGAEINCLMGNLMVASGIEPQPIQDCKIYRFDDRAAFDEKIKDVHVFSMADTALKHGIGDTLQEMYPEKSRYEI